jgi:hypothetical protein
MAQQRTLIAITVGDIHRASFLAIDQTLVLSLNQRFSPQSIHTQLHFASVFKKIISFKYMQNSKKHGNFLILETQIFRHYTI